MSFVVNYKGFEIGFREDGESWSCQTLTIHNESSLGAVKKKIDLMLRKDRQLDVKALMVGQGGFLYGSKVEQVTIKAFCAPERDYNARGDQPKERIKSCWIINEKGERQKTSLDNLFPLDLTPEIKGWQVLEKNAQRAAEIAREARALLTPFNVDTLSLAAKEQKAEENDKASAKAASS